MLKTKVTISVYIMLFRIHVSWGKGLNLCGKVNILSTKKLVSGSLSESAWANGLSKNLSKIFFLPKGSVQVRLKCNHARLHFSLTWTDPLQNNKRQNLKKKILIPFSAHLSSSSPCFQCNNRLTWGDWTLRREFIADVMLSIMPKFFDCTFCSQITYVYFHTISKCETFWNSKSSTSGFLVSFY